MSGLWSCYCPSSLILSFSDPKHLPSHSGRLHPSTFPPTRFLIHISAADSLYRRQNFLKGGGGQAAVSRGAVPGKLSSGEKEEEEDEEEKDLVGAKRSGTSARGRRLLRVREEKRKREYDRIHNYPTWAKILENACRDDEELRAVLGDSVGNPELMRKRVEERVRKKGRDFRKSKTGSILAFKVNFREFNPTDSFIWFELYSAPSDRDVDILGSVIQSWYVMGRLGAFNSSNLQVPIGRINDTSVAVNTCSPNASARNKNAQLQDNAGDSLYGTVLPSNSMEGCSLRYSYLQEQCGVVVKKQSPWMIVNGRNMSALMSSSKASPSIIKANLVQPSNVMKRDCSNREPMDMNQVGIGVHNSTQEMNKSISMDQGLDEVPVQNELDCSNQP